MNLSNNIQLCQLQIFVPWDMNLFIFRIQKHLQSDHCQSQALYTTDQILHKDSYKTEFFLYQPVMKNLLPVILNIKREVDISLLIHY